MFKVGDLVRVIPGKDTGYSGLKSRHVFKVVQADKFLVTAEVAFKRGFRDVFFSNVPLNTYLFFPEEIEHAS